MTKYETLDIANMHLDVLTNKIQEKTDEFASNCDLNNNRGKIFNPLEIIEFLKFKYGIKDDTDGDYIGYYYEYQDCHKLKISKKVLASIPKDELELFLVDGYKELLQSALGLFDSQVQRLPYRLRDYTAQQIKKIMYTPVRNPIPVGKQEFIPMTKTNHELGKVYKDNIEEKFVEVNIEDERIPQEYKKLIIALYEFNGKFLVPINVADDILMENSTKM